MYNKRFGLTVRITRHARERMKERGVSEGELFLLLENGKIKHKDAQRCWVYGALPGRKDNPVCAAVVLEDELVVKTVMIRWEVLE